MTPQSRSGSPLVLVCTRPQKPLPLESAAPREWRRHGAGRGRSCGKEQQTLDHKPKGNEVKSVLPLLTTAGTWGVVLGTAGRIELCIEWAGKGREKCIIKGELLELCQISEFADRSLHTFYRLNACRKILPLLLAQVRRKEERAVQSPLTLSGKEIFMVHLSILSPVTSCG